MQYFSDIQDNSLDKLLSHYQLQIEPVADNSSIPGSHFGDSEAGLIENRLYLRSDTPIHSALHEACHYICMDQQRRHNLHTDAGGDYDEENAVCFLQILLADYITGNSSSQLMQEMNEWGYTFRLGSSERWFEEDADDARQWLLEHQLINTDNEPTFRLREQEIQGNQMIRKCLFPAAGYGTRFLPATKSMPKEVLPILNKPLIQYGVEEALSADMHQIAIITGRGKRAIEDHFDINYELEHQISGTSKEVYLDDIRSLLDECTFSYTRQIEMKGLGHAILTGETLIGPEPFGVVLADDLCTNSEGDPVLKQMAKLYEKYRCSIVAIEEVPMEEISKYGVIACNELENNVFVVNDMVEKPEPEDAPSNLAIIGRYILTPDIFDIIRNTPPGRNGEVQITDALKTQAQKNMVLAYKFEGKRFDCGSIDGFVDATNHFYELLNQE